MRSRKSMGLIAALVLSVSLISVSLTAVLLSNYYGKAQFQLLGGFCGNLLEREPDSKLLILETLKEYKERPAAQTGKEMLSALGYRRQDFLGASQKAVFLFAGAGFLSGAFLFLSAQWFSNKREVLRIKALTGYLEKVNTGDQGLILEDCGDEFSILQDEIYKTVTTLYQMRDSAVQAKNNFAENLSNIAHQLKTPITAISLSTQMMKEHSASEYATQIQMQLNRLTHLEEALLLLSRIDAGTLQMDRKAVDVFTVLTLAADNLQALFDRAGVFVDIPENGQAEITADLDWTMEAVMNLFKNCMEHAPAGTTVHCSYDQNPLYVKIRIWDEGQGFVKEDLPHLFERFYRGRNAGDGGIGIGLALAKAIIEMQNGVLSAGNLQSGGAFFEIRIYSH